MTEDAQTHAAARKHYDADASEHRESAPRAPSKPKARERGRMRRRLRAQSRIREALLLDLGATVWELHRQGRREPELLQAKASQLGAVDDEVRGLAQALGDGHGIKALTGAGVAGSCPRCGSLLTPGSRYCQACGSAVGANGALAQPEPTVLEEPVEEPAVEEEPAIEEEPAVEEGPSEDEAPSDEPHAAAPPPPEPEAHTEIVEAPLPAPPHASPRPAGAPSLRRRMGRRLRRNPPQ